MAGVPCLCISIIGLEYVGYKIEIFLLLLVSNGNSRFDTKNLKESGKDCYEKGKADFNRSGYARNNLC